MDLSCSQPTDFKKLLKDHVKELDDQLPFDPEKHDFIKQFKEAVWVRFYTRYRILVTGLLVYIGYGYREFTCRTHTIH